MDAAAAAELRSATAVVDEAPGPSSVGTLEDELGGVVLLGAIGLLGCWRGLDKARLGDQVG